MRMNKHAHRDKEKTVKTVAERCDLRKGVKPEVRLCHHKTGQKRPKCERKTENRCQITESQCQEQNRYQKKLLASGKRNLVKEIWQDAPTSREKHARNNRNL